MAIKPNRSLFIFISLLCALASGSSLSKESPGKVTKADKRSEINGIREGEQLVIGADKLKNEPIEIGDTLTSYNDKFGAQLKFDLIPKNNRKTSITMEHATLSFTQEADGDLMCKVTGKVLYSRGRKVRFYGRKKNRTDECNVLFAGRTAYRAHGTQYLLDARGKETSLFVMDGSVEVFRANKDHPEKQMVYSGEWLVVHEDDEIPSPKRFRRLDVNTGSSDCIYSNCTINDKVPDLEPRSPGVLLPPPPNPPGLRR